MPSRLFLPYAIVCLLVTGGNAFSSSSIKARAFTKSGGGEFEKEKPKLILIGGCSGTGKSTFGMSVALDQGILKCISTDTLRSVMRSFVSREVSPALHRSSYEPATEDGSDDPVKSWKQTCTVLRHSVDELVDEMIGRGTSIVIEGVHLIPESRLIEKWEASGGVATGIMLTVPDEEAHRTLLLKRGATTGKGEEAKLEKFRRIRAIHDEMVRLAEEQGWQLIEQNLKPDPLEIVASQLWSKSTASIQTFTAEHLTSRTERRSEEFWTEQPEDVMNSAFNDNSNGKLIPHEA